MTKTFSRAGRAAIAASALSLALLTGCQSNPIRQSQGQVRHVVIAWLKPGADRDKVLASVHELSKIRGVVDYSAGYRIASERPMVDSTYDLAIVLTFDSVESLRAYPNDPVHLRITDQVVKPNVEKFVVYDSTIELYNYGESTDAATRQRRAAALEEQQKLNDRRH
jgi:hypothetical protein